MPKTELAERIAAVERLTKLFNAERMVHLGVTTISLVVLISAAILLLVRDGKEANVGSMSAMFGSSGLITYSATRLLHMWNQALALIAGKSLEEAK